jgi:hypothetical protein
MYLTLILLEIMHAYAQVQNRSRPSKIISNKRRSQALGVRARAFRLPKAKPARARKIGFRRVGALGLYMDFRIKTSFSGWLAGI